MYWLRWHYHVKDIAGAPYKIQRKTKGQNRRQSVVAGRQQLYCAVRQRGMTVPGHEDICKPKRPACNLAGRSVDSTRWHYATMQQRWLSLRSLSISVVVGQFDAALQVKSLKLEHTCTFKQNKIEHATTPMIDYVTRVEECVRKNQSSRGN